VIERICQTSTALLSGIEVCDGDEIALSMEEKSESEVGVRDEGKGDVNERGKKVTSYMGSLSKPLCAAVSDFESLSSSVLSMASVGYISEEGKSQQQNILQRAKRALSASLSLVSSLAGESDVEQSAVVDQCRSLAEELQGLLLAVRSSLPGESECDSAMSSLTELRSKLQEASKQACEHTLTVSYHS
jgi:hypothetical protein